MRDDGASLALISSLACVLVAVILLFHMALVRDEDRTPVLRRLKIEVGVEYEQRMD